MVFMYLYLLKILYNLYKLNIFKKINILDLLKQHVRIIGSIFKLL